MRIGRWTRGGNDEDGFIEDAGVVPFPDARTVTDVVADGLASLAALRSRAGEPVAALSDVTLRAPIAPASVRDFVAFEEHVEGVSGAVDGRNEVVPEWYEFPTFYFTNPHTVTGPGEITPPVTSRLDFELEVAVIVGREGSNLSVDEADDAIFGYTIMNDWSARDLQSREMRVKLGPCKGKDFATSIGPWIVTADELAPYRVEGGFLALRAEVYVNGELVGHDLVSNAGWPFSELVAYASRASRVVPGDVLGSGTVGNGGCLGELWGRGGTRPPLAEGDEVRMVVEGIGELLGSVGAAIAPPTIGPARERSRARRR